MNLAERVTKMPGIAATIGEMSPISAVIKANESIIVTGKDNTRDVKTVRKEV